MSGATTELRPLKVRMRKLDQRSFSQLAKQSALNLPLNMSNLASIYLFRDVF